MSVCIIISNQTSQANMNSILDFYKGEEILLAMNSVFPNYVLNSFEYPCFNIITIINDFRGKVVFGNLVDFNENSNMLLKGFHQKVLFTEKESLVRIKASIVDTEIFFFDKNNIRKAKNAELQPMLR